MEGLQENMQKMMASLGGGDAGHLSEALAGLGGGLDDGADGGSLKDRVARLMQEHGVANGMDDEAAAELDEF